MAEVEKDISGKDHDNQNKRTKIITKINFYQKKKWQLASSSSLPIFYCFLWWAQ